MVVNMIATLKRTKEILNKYNLHAKKGYGQNFLIDPNVVNRIVDEAHIDKECGVIEIGPGIGSLTEVLVSSAKKVICYEIDKDMVDILNDNFKGCQNLKIIEKDFLKADLREDLDYFSDCKKVLVVSNLPYYITTPIVFKLLGEEVGINDFYFMVQKEVGERFSGKPKTKDYNSLSVAIMFQADSKILFNVSRNSFYPAPNVDSVIINIKKVQKDYKVNNKAEFLKFVQSIFSQRRKTLVNNLSVSCSLSKAEIEEKLEENGFKKTVRSEELEVSQIVNLYNIFRG